MKTFISFSPQQVTLKQALYEPRGNERLAYGPTSFPIIPVINGYTLPGEEIRVILVIQDHEPCRVNSETFRAELEALCSSKQLRCPAIEEICVPFDDSVATHIATFQKLIDHIHDGDDLHACITYGSKPSPMVELMALRYARQVKKDTYISCIAYGQVNFRTGEAGIYDETALAHLDDIIRVLAQSGDPNPKAALDQIIGM